MSNRMGRRCCIPLLGTLAALLPAGAAFADEVAPAERGPARPPPSSAPPSRMAVSYDKAIEIPAIGAEVVRIVNRLGRVQVRGWDRPAVQVTATKEAPSEEMGERLRVRVSSRNGREIEVRTYVRLRPALPEPMTRALRGLLERQARVLEQLVGRRVVPAAAQSEMRGVERELEQLVRRYADAPSRPYDLGVPVARGRLDLQLHVPRNLRVSARTFRDPVTVEGCAAGAEISSEEGALEVRQTRGPVVTWTRHGSQRLVEVDGPTKVGGGEVDVLLRAVTGPVRAALVSGRIDARALGARFASLRTVHGEIRVGPAPPGGRYAALTHDGDVIVEAGRRDPFRVEAWAPLFELGPVELHRVLREGHRLTGQRGRGGGLLRLETRRGKVRFER